MVLRRKVQRIIDGNTFVVSKKIGKTNIIKLAGTQEFSSKEAANKLRKLISGKTVTIVPVDQSPNKHKRD